MTKQNTSNSDQPHVLTEKEKDQKVKNMAKEAKAKDELGEDMPGVLPTTDGDASALDQAKASDQAGETVMAPGQNPANEIGNPRKGEPTIAVLNSEGAKGEEERINVKKVWDMNFSNAGSNIEGLGHAFAAVGVDFTSAPVPREEEDDTPHAVTYALNWAEDEKKKEIGSGKLLRNATTDDVYQVFLDFCLINEPKYLGQFGAHATKND